MTTYGCPGVRTLCRAFLRRSLTVIAASLGPSSRSSRNCGRGPSSSIGAVKVRVETDDGEAKFLRRYVLVDVVKVQVKVGGCVEHFLQLFEGQRYHRHARLRIRQELAKHLRLLAAQKNQADGVKGIVRNEELMLVYFFQKIPGFFGLCLLQQQLEENVGVNQQPHSPSILQRAI